VPYLIQAVVYQVPDGEELRIVGHIEVGRRSKPEGIFPRTFSSKIWPTSLPLWLLKGKANSIWTTALLKPSYLSSSELYVCGCFFPRAGIDIGRSP
jgi:hypothetical protein